MAEAAACLATSDCRVASRQRGEPASVRVHFVIDTKLFAELRGSWLHAAITDRVLDCSDRAGRALHEPPSAGLPVWQARPFAPLALR